MSKNESIAHPDSGVCQYFSASSSHDGHYCQLIATVARWWHKRWQQFPLTVDDSFTNYFNSRRVSIELWINEMTRASRGPSATTEAEAPCYFVVKMVRRSTHRTSISHGKQLKNNCSQPIRQKLVIASSQLDRLKAPVQRQTNRNACQRFPEAQR